VHQLRAALDTRLRTLLVHDPSTRAALKAVRPLLDRAWADDLRTELGWLGGRWDRYATLTCSSNASATGQPASTTPVAKPWRP
jgi:hypothetical protein